MARVGRDGFAQCALAEKLVAMNNDGPGLEFRDLRRQRFF